MNLVGMASNLTAGSCRSKPHLPFFRIGKFNFLLLSYHEVIKRSYSVYNLNLPLHVVLKRHDSNNYPDPLQKAECLLSGNPHTRMPEIIQLFCQMHGTLDCNCVIVLLVLWLSGFARELLL